MAEKPALRKRKKSIKLPEDSHALPQYVRVARAVSKQLRVKAWGQAANMHCERDDTLYVRAERAIGVLLKQLARVTVDSAGRTDGVAFMVITNELKAATRAREAAGHARVGILDWRAAETLRDLQNRVAIARGE